MGARADRYAEHRSRFWISVDGDGDGIRQNIAVSPAVDVVAGPPVALILTGPTTAEVGEAVRYTIALLDGRGNAGYPWTGEV
ncbi:MAG: hypothetical protein GWO04_20090, partial [Actinobacteria bacterium]|nr:hypothetical protein [Actinomycetota bacterium]